MNNNNIITCCGFHRSATSITAHWIHKAGLAMGNWLMPGAESNPDGHFEDMPMVMLNNKMLELQDTSWLFHDEVPLRNDLSIYQYSLYIKQRDRIHLGSPWAVKDPRLCLFLPEWDLATRGRARYVIVIRHWQSCIKSLIERDKDFPSILSKRPELAAKMWYSYNSRLLDFIKKSEMNCLILEQSQLSKTFPLIKLLNDKFGLSLDESVESPFKEFLIHNQHTEIETCTFLSASEAGQMDDLWCSLEKLLVDKSNSGDMLSSSERQIHVVDKFVDSEYSGDLSINLSSEASLDQSKIQNYWVGVARDQIFHLNWSVAEKVLEWLILYSEVPPYVLVMLAECKYHLDKKHEAILLYNKAIKKNLKKPNFYLKLGQLYLNEGNLKSASRIFTLGVKNNPSDCRWLKSALESISF